MIYKKRNRSKAKVLLVLFDKRVNQHSLEGMEIKNISRCSKVSQKYLWRRMTTWAKWHYIKREIGDNGRSVYSILQKGINFLEKLSTCEVEELLAEIRGKSELDFIAGE